MAWLWFVDTSHHTDYVLLLAVDGFVAAMVVATALFVGLGSVAATLVVLLVLLLVATEYARSLAKREQTEALRRAVKIRLPR